MIINPILLDADGSYRHDLSRISPEWPEQFKYYYPVPWRQFERTKRDKLECFIQWHNLEVDMMRPEAVEALYVRLPSFWPDVEVAKRLLLQHSRHRSVSMVDVGRCVHRGA